MKYLLIGAAVAALTVCPLNAQGKGHGQGNGGGHGNGANGPSMAPARPGPTMQSAHGNGHDHGGMKGVARAHGNGQGNGRANAHSPGQTTARDVSHANNGHGQTEVMRAAKSAAPRVPLGKANDQAKGERPAGKSQDGVRQLNDGRHYYTARGTREAFGIASIRRGLIDGCPPGLAKKNNGCQPPGQARQNISRPIWWGAPGLANGRYLYDDGYLLRMNGTGVASYLPLLGGALSVGNIWPSAYTPLPVPQYYVDYYDLGPVGSYRYADNVLYRVDPSSSAITAIAALLTGDTFQIGSPIPPGYDIYNVPYQYRSEYIDGPDARYRYSDGYIYQVDPTTQLITAAIDLLASRRGVSR